jgi:hypothetical protein
MRIHYKGLLCGIGLALAVQTASAATIAESGDAGDSLGTAQSVPGGTTQITGALSAGSDVDLYRFSWGGGVFSANTYTNDDSTHPDPMLSLFDSSGHGIQMDDDSGFFADPTFHGLPALLAPTNLAAGTYYIALSSFANQAVDGSAAVLFACLNQCGPVDANATLAGWNGNSFFGEETYVINLPATASLDVPAPGAALLLASGLIGFGVLRSRGRRARD